MATTVLLLRLVRRRQPRVRQQIARGRAPLRIEVEHWQQESREFTRFCLVDLVLLGKYGGQVPKLEILDVLQLALPVEDHKSHVAGHE